MAYSNATALAFDRPAPRPSGPPSILMPVRHDRASRSAVQWLAWSGETIAYDVRVRGCPHLIAACGLWRRALSDGQPLRSATEMLAALDAPPAKLTRLLLARDALDELLAALSAGPDGG